MKTAEGRIRIEAHLECPHCDTKIDLFGIESLTDNDQLRAVINEDDHLEWENYQELIDCPDCYKKIQIEGLSYT